MKGLRERALLHYSVCHGLGHDRQLPQTVSGEVCGSYKRFPVLLMPTRRNGF